MTVAESQDVARADAVPGRARRILAQFSAVGALLILTYCAGEYLADNWARVDLSVWLTFLGIGLLWLALALARFAPPVFPIVTSASITEPVSSARRWAARAAVAAGVAGMVALTEINARIFGWSSFWDSPQHVQFPLLIGSIALLIWGFNHCRVSLPRWRDFDTVTRRELIFVVVVTFIALALRLYNLEGLRAFIDEGNFLEPLKWIKRYQNVPLLHPLGSIAAFPMIYPYLQSLGADVAGDMLIGMRVPSAILGALAVPVMYLLTKLLFDRRVAFAMAILIATFPVHLQWSRLGMNNIADPLFGALMVALLVRGARRGGAWHFAAAGVCFGLTQYFYEGGRLVFAGIVAVWFLYLMMLTLWRKLPKNYVLIFLFTAFVIGAPIYITLSAINSPLTARFDAVRRDENYWTGDINDFVRRYPDALRWAVFLYVREAEPTTYYSGDHPYIQVYLVPLLLLGIGVILWRWRSPGGSLLLVWVFGSFVAITVLINGVDSARMFVLFPALMVLCALGVAEITRLIANRHAVIGNVLLVTVTLLIGVMHVIYFFGIHIERFTQQHYAVQPEQELIFRARDLPDGTVAHYITTRYVRQGYLDSFVKAFNPEVTVEIALPTQLDDYIAKLPFDPKQVFYLADSDVIAFYKLHKRFELSAPVRWLNIYNTSEWQFVAYYATADRQAVTLP